MSKLQVLVATMHQTDFSLVEKMNIHANVIIANQADEESVREMQFEGFTAKMITTKTRGVGINRNIALQAADAEIVLFADDDIVYRDDAFQQIEGAFCDLPKADLITFSADFTKNGKVYLQRRNPTKQCRVWNSMQFGAAFLAARRQTIAEKRLEFSTLFGGGCIYGSGEDSLFLRDCLKHGLRLYSHDFVIGSCAKDESTWFTGYNEKFFYDKGAWLAAAFPKSHFLLKWYFLLRHKHVTELSLSEMRHQMNRGIRGYRTRIPYSEKSIEDNQ